ncbi:hypothetical protein EJB05_40112 [Eragrostis curvula]|uniref:Uncharacterized protein n=1 Tax=Eragrostis curvula TaxID=38414 RepID=A0A5J9TYQ4_9POAL|nr:hypothetical protein EJB05_40112 [Eragrostis curvula]
MVLRFLSRILRRDQPSDSPPADSPPPTSQGGSDNGARANDARKTKGVEHMLADLEKEGVEIDGKIASIIDDEVARIITEAAREDINEPWTSLLDDIACIFIGFWLGVEYTQQHILWKILFG